MTAGTYTGVSSAGASRPARNTPGFSESLASVGSRLPGALDEHFERVDHLPLDPTAPLPFENASVDCVALHDASLAMDSPNAAALLAECSRILKPGGWLYVGMSNDASFSRVRRSPLAWAARFAFEVLVPSIVRRAMSSSTDAAVHRAGFAQVRRYFAWPSEASQRMLIPAERTAAVAHERLDRIASKRGRLRATIAGFGLYSGLYPVRIFLCRR
jgi:SAM-dependent methyltransferase